MKSVPENLFLKTCSAVSSEHGVPPSPPWIPFGGCCRLAVAATQGSISAGPDGKCPGCCSVTGRCSWQVPVSSWHYLHVNCLAPFISLKHPTSSFAFSWKWYLRWGLWQFWWITQFSCVSPSFLCGSMVKNLPINAGATGDVCLISGLGRHPGEGNGNRLQYSCLDNSMGRGPRRSLWGHKESAMTE